MGDLQQTENTAITLATAQAVTTRAQIGGSSAIINCRDYSLITLLVDYSNGTGVSVFALDFEGTDLNLPVADWYRIGSTFGSGGTADNQESAKQMLFSLTPTTPASFKVALPLLTLGLPYIRVFGTAVGGTVTVNKLSYIRTNQPQAMQL